MKTVIKSVKSEPLKFSKKIGSTVYNVTAHFSQTSKETVEDKMLRIIENAVSKIA
ncbi:MAG: transposon-encoded TnpW family protein [Oscillospiraceae bacterium]|nr:transposon-encoded TnpW family protein [Oscillospiraceae bacterium]